MKPKKEDLMITYDKSKYSISIRKRTFYFFTQWIPLTYQEAEYSGETTVMFDDFEQANKFIDLITQ